MNAQPDIDIVVEALRRTVRECSQGVAIYEEHGGHLSLNEPLVTVRSIARSALPHAEAIAEQWAEWKETFLPYHEPAVQELIAAARGALNQVQGYGSSHAPNDRLRAALKNLEEL